jgi:hypothetical protein
MSAQTDIPGGENIQAALLAILKKLSPERQRQALEFAEFLSEREEQTNGQAIQQTEAKPVHQDRVRRRQPGEDWPDTECLQEHQWLKAHGAEYAGQWVALDGHRLIAHSNDPRTVFAAVREARQAGVKSPFITRIDSPDDLPFGGW